MKRLIRNSIRSLGIDIVRYRPQRRGQIPADIPARDREVLERVTPYTMTSRERQAALVEAVRYVVQRGLDGCFVECGVWRGGSSMAMALTLMQEGVTSRNLYLFDTFEGMTPPSEVDRTPDGVTAQTHLDLDTKREGYWCVADREDVAANMRSTGYPEARVHLVKGPVEQTIPAQMPPEPISLLRLDTDWYESTRHELEHLFPRLCQGGVLIIDDYGHWEGARKAVDEYFAAHGQRFLFHRVDYTARLLIKQ
jgi:hypothetical protein